MRPIRAGSLTAVDRAEELKQTKEEHPQAGRSPRLSRPFVLGRTVDRTHRELTDADISIIADTYHVWRTGEDASYADIPSFCRYAGLDEVRKRGHVLTPGAMSEWTPRRKAASRSRTR